MIPFLFYLFKDKKTNGFINSLGLKASNNKANLLALLGSIILLVPFVLLVLISDEFRDVFTAPSTLTGKFKDMGLSINTVLIILMTAVFKTSFAEELFFRGFIAKKLINRIGYSWGNLLQALLFGALHLMIFAAITQSFLFLAIIMFFTGLSAYFSVYLNEKLAGGSIIPGWISHGMANILSYSFASFLL